MALSLAQWCGMELKMILVTIQNIDLKSEQAEELFDTVHVTSDETLDQCLESSQIRALGVNYNLVVIYGKTACRLDLIHFLAMAERERPGVDSPLCARRAFYKTDDRSLPWYEAVKGTARLIEDCDAWAEGHADGEILYLPRGILDQLPVQEVVFNAHLVPTPEILLDQITLPLDKRKSVLFLDRDGIINKDLGYVASKDQLTFLPEVFPLIEWANSLSMPVVVVTNQSGIARGKYCQKDVIELHKYMHQELLKRGLEVSKWLYSPYHAEGDPASPFSKKNISRKPAPGLFLEYAKGKDINFFKSFMVGDKKSDVIQGLPLITALLKGAYPLDKVADEFLFNSHQEILDFLKNKAQN